MNTHNLAIAIGDPAGIGISTNILAFLHHPTLVRTANIFIFGHPQYYCELANKYSLNYSYKSISIDEADSYTDELHNTVFHICDETQAYHPITAGMPTNQGHIIAYQSLQAASQFVQRLNLQKKCAALVTNPLNKAGIINNIAPDFLDQTKFLTDQFCTNPAGAGFMMKSHNMHMVFVTSHIKLSAVSGKLSQQNIVSKGEMLIDHLQTYESKPTPVIGVLSLNPHAGEAGMLGNEEIQIIQPAVAQLQQTAGVILGPLSNDRAFNPRNRNKIDGYICMYHDQGIVPLNTIDENSAVNVTLGLNFIRTSPGHGTAYDIAGTDLVNYHSFNQAVGVALQYSGKKLQMNTGHNTASAAGP